MDTKKVYFNEVAEAPYTFANPTGSQPISPAFGGGGDQVIQIGSGDTAFTVDLTGMWMGAGRFNQAPFRVKMNGEQVAKILTEDDDVILDSKGILSEFNFPFSEKVKPDDQTITGTDWQNVTGLSHVLVLTRPTNVLLMANMAGYHDDVDGRLEFRFIVNSVQVGQIFCVNQVADPTTIQTKTGIAMARIQNGNNDIAIQARSSNANSGYVMGSVLPSNSIYLIYGNSR